MAEIPAAAARAMELRNSDFLAGAWRATERWLPRCGEGSDDWRGRPAFLVLHRLLGGMANAEEITYPDSPGFAIATFRTYEIATDEWIYVYGIDRAMPGMSGGQGTLIPALRSRFADNRGEFVGTSEYEGRPVLASYIWRDVTAITARWERWFSFDKGKSWERNVEWNLVRERTLG